MLSRNKTEGNKHILLGLIQYSIFDRIFDFIRWGSIISTPSFLCILLFCFDLLFLPVIGAEIQLHQLNYVF